MAGDDPVEEAGNQQESKEQLSKLSLKDLQARLKELKARTTGNKTELVDRPFELLNAGFAAQDPVNDLQRQLNVTREGAEQLNAEGFDTVEDVKMLRDQDDVKKALSFLTKFRDKVAVECFLKKLSSRCAQRAPPNSMSSQQQPPKEDLRDTIT